MSSSSSAVSASPVLGQCRHCGRWGGSAQPQAPAQPKRGCFPGMVTRSPRCVWLQTERGPEPGAVFVPAVAQATRGQPGSEPCGWPRRTEGRTDGRTEPEAGRQCGGGFIAGWQRGAAASFGSGSLGAVGAHVGAELGARGPLVAVWDPIPGAAPGSGTRGGRHPSGATGRLRRQGRGGRAAVPQGLR